VQIVVHAQRCYRGPPCGRAADNRLLIIGPPKMLIPNLNARVKKSGLASGPRVNPHCPARLGQIASRAGQGAVRQRVGAALRPWNNVFNVKAIAAYPLRRMTVFTTPKGTLLHTSAQFRCGQCSASSCQPDSLIAPPAFAAAPQVAARCATGSPQLRGPTPAIPAPRRSEASLHCSSS
jgi:hypothetical protein